VTWDSTQKLRTRRQRKGASRIFEENALDESAAQAQIEAILVSSQIVGATQATFEFVKRLVDGREKRARGMFALRVLRRRICKPQGGAMPGGKKIVWISGVKYWK
jgi:hypothetical protein